MPNDQQISILVDVARNGGSALPPDRLNDLNELIRAGYIVGNDNTVEPYKLTRKGQKLLDDRGVGANES